LKSLFKQAALWPLLLVMLGCASNGSLDQRIPTRTAAILGVTLAPGVEAGRSQSAMVRELENMMQSAGAYRVLRSHDVGPLVNAVSAGSYGAMLSNYARYGQFKAYDIQALQAAQLPVQSALIVRVEKNAVRSGTPRRIELRNSAGQVLTDREQVLLSTVRETQLRASMLSLRSGKVIWSKSYRASPSTESSYVHYSGSSFSGSLAASFANTMSNGLRVPSGPVPPSNLLTVRSLLREVVRNLPGQ